VDDPRESSISFSNGTAGLGPNKIGPLSLHCVIYALSETLVFVQMPVTFFESSIINYPAHPITTHVQSPVFRERCHGELMCSEFQHRSLSICMPIHRIAYLGLLGSYRGRLVGSHFLTYIYLSLTRANTLDLQPKKCPNTLSFFPLSCGKWVRRYLGLQASSLSPVVGSRNPASPNVLRLSRVKRGHLSRDGKTTRFRYLPAQRKTFFSFGNQPLAGFSVVLCTALADGAGRLSAMPFPLSGHMFHCKDIVSIR
jgi:hypothetical protein